MGPSEYSRRIGEPVRALGGAFMLDTATIVPTGPPVADWCRIVGIPDARGQVLDIVRAWANSMAR